MAISVERLFAVKFPATHFNLSWRPVACAISMTWLLGIFIAGGRFLMTEPQWTYVIISLSSLLPTVVIIGSYIMLYIAAKESMAIWLSPCIYFQNKFLPEKPKCGYVFEKAILVSITVSTLQV